MMEHLCEKHSYPNIFFIVINQEMGVFQQAVLPGDVIRDFPALDCIFVLSVTLVLALSCQQSPGATQVLAWTASQRSPWGI